MKSTTVALMGAAATVLAGCSQGPAPSLTKRVTLSEVMADASADTAPAPAAAAPMVARLGAGDAYGAMVYRAHLERSDQADERYVHVEDAGYLIFDH